MLGVAIVMLSTSSGAPPPSLLAMSTTIVAALKAHNMATVASAVSPTGGIWKLRFSPYPWFDSSNRLFTQAQVFTSPTSNLWTSSITYNWGKEDPSNITILGKFKTKYYPNYLWVHDYTQSGVTTSVDSRGGGASTFTTNWASVYPNRHYVEFYYHGTSANNYYDWSSLILIWKQQGSTWRLVAITSDMHGI